MNDREIQILAKQLFNSPAFKKGVKNFIKKTIKQEMDRFSHTIPPSQEAVIRKEVAKKRKKIDENKQDILDYLDEGSENAITRPALTKRIGLYNNAFCSSKNTAWNFALNELLEEGKVIAVKIMKHQTRALAFYKK